MSKTFGLVYLAALLLIVLGMIVFGHPTAAIETLLVGIAVQLVSKIQTVFDFFFGSSQGSKDKDVLLNQPTQTPPAVVPAPPPAPPAA